MNCVTIIARRTVALGALLALAVGAAGCSKLKARDLLNKGVTAFKNGQSDAAIEDFFAGLAIAGDATNAAAATQLTNIKLLLFILSSCCAFL